MIGVGAAAGFEVVSQEQAALVTETVREML